MARLFSWAIVLFPVFLYFDICHLVAGLNVSACFKDEKDSLNATCPSGYMVRILRSFYGHSSRGACSYEENDCTHEEEQNYPCMGRESCRVNLPTRETGRRTKKCDFNYFQVEYQCVKRSEIRTICNTKQLTDQSGYISSDRYPNNVQGRFTCSLNIRVEPHRKIQLYILDLDLKGERNKNCTDYLFLNLGVNTITICNRSVNEKSFPTSKNELNLTLTMASAGKRKGLWLYYEAIPPLASTPVPKEPTKKYPTTERPVSPKLIASERNTKVAENPTVKNYQHYQSDPKPQVNNSVIFVAATAGVIGTLLFILITFLIFLVFKIQIKKKRQKVYSNFIVQNQDRKNASHNQTLSNLSNIEI
ncbi:uncharacterized protein LOC106884421 [Octopus bimaculoides]|uniref:CUB domain-containing protein n=1 Tax=Octopus bimaculoides TaxID=37653 RepID=A0A0L8I2Y7_OCTBM|nr:uncharacterized protein LOC106884421 [Octopus bimaculoides]XP_014791280.1 uncharacterized protein LOC106884421 [Octopus bimaculoides]XP_014791281.1 uncharacterized protein LOC106884421 [Octopus bimaculoides]XP_052828249.1 uncharacterized protein LOC106884421 [Octopus bimaculoides]XP_052828256.1 uncharacterized protein LOC106884421 [Octopus bimaculoides]|eukprot:XP_014791279.1 PREDICTED: uncharacterized protein LOC106884421 [Octopus bimaculoides]